MYGVPCCHASFLSPGSDPKLLCLDDRSGDTCFSLQILKALDSDCVCFGDGGGRIQYGSTTLFLQVSRGCLGDHRQSEEKAEQGIPGSMQMLGCLPPTDSPLTVEPWAVNRGPAQRRGKYRQVLTKETLHHCLPLQSCLHLILYSFIEHSIT